MSDRDGLAAWLTELWGTPTQVEIVGQSTAGARRRNVLFDATAEGTTHHLVATILPTQDIAILSMVDEAGVRSVARDHGVPVPHVLGASMDESWVGGGFFVSELVPGETIPRRLLRLVDANPGLGERIVAQLGTAFAHLHAVDSALAPAALARPAEPVAAALAGVRAITTTLLQPEPAYAYGVRWLARHQPTEPGRHTIVHADVRTGNIIVDEQGLRAVLDWETSKVGDPMEDLAWVCTRMWRFGRDELTVGGLGTVATLREAYEAAGGVWDEERFLWWRVLTTLRWGLGLAGQAAAHLDGTYVTVVMAASGRRVSEIAFDFLSMITPDEGASTR
ncbi:MAG TPA: phosphotransferase family protein [Acidimicrobiales bacterium]